AINLTETQPSLSPLAPSLTLFKGTTAVANSAPGAGSLSYTIPAGGDGAYYARVTVGGADTVSFWMNWNGSENIMPVGFSSYDLYFIGGGFGFNTANSDLWGMSSARLANSWHFVTAVFANGDPTQSQLYIDGVKQNLTQRTGTTITSRTISSAVRISGWPNDGNYRFGGKIDEVAFFNRALSAAEIQAQYDARGT